MILVFKIKNEYFSPIFHKYFPSHKSTKKNLQGTGRRLMNIKRTQ